MNKSTQPDTLAYPVTSRRDRGCVDVVWGRLRCPGPHSADIRKRIIYGHNYPATSSRR